MKTLYDGHLYALSNLDYKHWDDKDQELQFVQREPHHAPKPGTTNQEVCRALIARIKVLDAELPWEGNALILQNLRQIIMLHEVRAYMRHCEKVGLTMKYSHARSNVLLWMSNTLPVGTQVEDIPVNDDGHWEMPV